MLWVGEIIRRGEPPSLLDLFSFVDVIPLNYSRPDYLKRKVVLRNPTSDATSWYQVDDKSLIHG